MIERATNRPTWTAAGIGQAAIEIKKSRFIAIAGPCTDEVRARDFVAAQGASDCRHVCWAFRTGDRYRFDDAGEPAGTAGRPILTAIATQRLDDTVVVVNRYFGGIKLGAGGLARAYGRAAGEALKSMPRQEIVETCMLRCRVPFVLADTLHQVLARAHAVKQSMRYDRDEFEVHVRLPVDAVKRFEQALRRRTHGRCEIERIEPANGSR